MLTGTSAKQNRAAPNANSSKPSGSARLSTNWPPPKVAGGDPEGRADEHRLQDDRGCNQSSQSGEGADMADALDDVADRHRAQRIPAVIRCQDRPDKRGREVVGADPNTDQRTEKAIGELDRADPDDQRGDGGQHFTHDQPPGGMSTRDQVAWRSSPSLAKLPRGVCGPPPWQSGCCFPTPTGPTHLGEAVLSRGSCLAGPPGYEVLTGCGPALKPGARGITKGPAGPRTPERAGGRNECYACPLIAGRDGPPYFLVVGFSTVDDGWRHEPRPAWPSWRSACWRSSPACCQSWLAWGYPSTAP